MTDKYIPEESLLPEETIPEEEIPEGIVPAEEVAEESVPTEEILEETAPTAENAVAEELIEEFLAENPEELIPEAEDDTLPPEPSSEYMENYPTMPEIPVEPEIIEGFDDEGEFQEMFEKKDKKKKPSQKERPARKGRPARKKGYGLWGIPHLMAAIIWLLIIVAIGTTLGRIVWVCAADVLAFGRESKEVTVSITSDDNMESIATKLHEAGLVNYPELFLLFADLTDVEEKGKITTGTFTLNTIYDYNALIKHMSPRAGNRAVIEDVLIPEGYSCRQIFALLEEKGICKAADLEAWAANGELDDYWFLEGVERGDKYCLEGFLFPDTYDFYENSTPKQALEKMLDGFNYRFTDEMKEMLPQLNERLTAMMKKNGDSEAFIKEHQLDLRELITVASLIEEETANNTESYKIASVIYNRLFSWGSNPRYLNIDGAIFYALGEHKDALTSADLQVDSPYNTYLYQGLVPGPISNPGLASIKAALNFEDTSYFYYVLNPETGSHQFSKTYTEHQKWVEKFRGN